jgi:signal transduction histidine kinase
MSEAPQNLYLADAVVGVVGDLPPALSDLPVFGTATRLEVEATAAVVSKTAVDAWLVGPTRHDVVRAIGKHGAPALFLVEPDALARVLRQVSRNGHDVGVLPGSIAEFDARVEGMLRRRYQWNGLTSMLCREIAHDLRSPLQALNLLADEMTADSPTFADDLDMLRRAAHSCKLLTTSISNLGHHPNRAWVEPVGPETKDVGVVLADVAAGASFRGRIDLEIGEALPVTMPKRLLARTVEDILRITYQRMRQNERMRVLGISNGDEAVLIVTAPVYPAFLAHQHRVTSREAMVMLKRRKFPVPFTGLAFANECVASIGGKMKLREDDEGRLEIEVRMPLAS